MKTLVSTLIAVFVLPSLSLAAPGDVEGKIPLPFNHPTGIAWDGRNIWVADRKTDRFYRCDPATGAVRDSIESPGYFPSGLAWDGKLLWSTDPAEQKIYATDVGSGRTVVTLDAPSPGVTGIAAEGAFLWICDNVEDRISKIDPGDGTTIVSFRAPAGDPRGIVFGGGYLWCSDRIKDQIYMIDPRNGHVILILDAPGKYAWGLAWRDGQLLCADYQDDAVYTLVVRDRDRYRTFEPRRAAIDFTTEIMTAGEGSVVSLDVFYAVPQERPNQKLLAPVEYTEAPRAVKKDRWGQEIAAFRFESLAPPRRIEVGMRLRLETAAIRYFIYPENVGAEIPADIKAAYLADGVKYDIGNPYIKRIVAETVGDEKNLYWKARLLYQYVIDHMEYLLAGGWNTAPTVLKRGNGSCSEYTFSYIALCRAAGVPARYVGSLVVRGDDASYDDVFHRWCEIYLPGYGWVPVDANAGDRESPAEQAAAFGGIANRFLVTTEGGGDSEYLDWSYNAQTRYETTGKCRVRIESIAEWEPLE
jgi:hypothetical protein